VEVVQALPPGRILMRGRPSNLTHVLMVLLGNALDALEASGADRRRISLRVEPAGSDIMITIEDNAAGEDACPAEKIFDTFISPKGEKHMGLGLGMARKLVEESMGGSIIAENGSAGIRFILRLPVRVSSETADNRIPLQAQDSL